MRNLVLAILFCAVSAQATTYYVRNDGGTRYSANQPTNRCNGQTDAADTGSGTNQPCAFGDVRYLWSDGTAAGNWALTGGDTAIIRGGPWRVGAINNSGAAFNGYTNNGQGNFNEYAPPIPNGTSPAHTKILGENFANCSAKTQLFGGFGVLIVLDLRGAQFVDVQCLELTDHAQCTRAVSGVSGADLCANSAPFSDYAGTGIYTNTSTHDVLLQDLNIHGFSSNGLFGPIGGLITMTRVNSSFNPNSGWTFDDGNDTDNAAGSTITASYVTMEWNGCIEEYPIVDAIPAYKCFDTNDGGFGDSWSGQDAQLSMTCDHCITRYNTKDGFLGPHVRFGSLTITNSYFYNNMGGQLKFGTANNGTTKIQNTLVVGNCKRMALSVTGTPSTFNTGLTGFCRANDTFDAIWPTTGSFEMDNDTLVAASVNNTVSWSCTETYTAATLNAAGSGYQVNDVVTMVHSFVYGLQITVTGVSGGAITTFNLTNGGQGLFPVSSFGPYNNVRTIGGHGSGATLNIATNAGSGNTCAASGGNIMRNVVWLGYTNTDNASYNGSTIGLFCYSACNNSPGTTATTQWTNRTTNLFFGFKAGTDACSKAGETCSDPLFTSEPSQTWTNEAQLDSFNTSTGFGITSGSPAKYAGTAIGGLTNDYNNLPYHSPPSDGALEFVSSGGTGLVPGRQPRL